MKVYLLCPESGDNKRQATGMARHLFLYARNSLFLTINKKSITCIQYLKKLPATSHLFV